jgi:hypothetical protein
MRKEDLIKMAYSEFLERAEEIKTAYLEGDLLGSQPHIDAMFSNQDELVILTEKEFLDKCQTDKEFSESHGLQIEERELERDERFKIAYKIPEIRMALEAQSAMLKYPYGHNKIMDDNGIPTRVITITNKKGITKFYE